MKILALDLATKTGVCFGSPSTTPIFFTEILGDTGEHHGARFAQAIRMMNRLIKTYEPGLIVLEAPIKTNKTKRNPEEVLMGLRGCVMGIAHMHHVPFEQHEVKTVRTHFIGQGNLKSADAKAAVMKRCKQLGWNPKNLDESDSGAVWDYACSRQSRSHAISTLKSTTPLLDKL